MISIGGVILLYAECKGVKRRIKWYSRKGRYGREGSMAVMLRKVGDYSFAPLAAFA